MARVLKASGVDFLKVHDERPRDAYFAIAGEAKSHGLAFAGHVPRTVTVAEAAEAGQASIEHLANFRVFIECSGDNPYRPEGCAALFDLLAAKGVWQTPTLAFFETVPEMFSGDAPPSSDYAAPSLRDVWRHNQEASQLSDDANMVAGAGARRAGRDRRYARPEGTADWPGATRWCPASVCMTSWSG